jgi:hypothetical protein
MRRCPGCIWGPSRWKMNGQLSWQSAHHIHNSPQAQSKVTRLWCIFFRKRMWPDCWWSFYLESCTPSTSIHWSHLLGASPWCYLYGSTILWIWNTFKYIVFQGLPSIGGISFLPPQDRLKHTCILFFRVQNLAWLRDFASGLSGARANNLAYVVRQVHT